MKTYQYVLEDITAEQVGPVFEAVNDSVAIRSVKKLNLPDGEFRLWIIAERDDLQVKSIKVRVIKHDTQEEK